MSARRRILSRIVLPLLLCALSFTSATAQEIIDAVRRNDLAAVQRLLAANPRLVAATDSGGSTPLHWAANQGNIPIMQTLFAYRAGVNIQQREGWTPVHSAAIGDQETAIQLLWEHGANLDIRTTDGNAPIHIAAHHGRVNALGSLLSNGVDVNALNADGNTPLAVAAWYGQTYMGQDLIASGASLTIKNKFGKTAMDEANRAGKSDFARMLTAYQQALDERAARDLVRASSGLRLRIGYAGWTDPRAITRTVYSDDFHGEKAGQEWKSTREGSDGSPPISATPIGKRRFLGEFGNHAAILTLKDLPEHQEIAITFDLFIIRSMDGQMTGVGPDLWSLGVVDGPTLLQTTFANQRTGVRPKVKIQAYPGEYPGDHNSPCTGAEETNTLGYTFKYDTVPSMDSVYKIRYTFASSSRAILFRFAGSNLQELDDESWGITNVQVAVGVLPPGAVSNVAHPALVAKAPARTATHAATTRPTPRRATVRRPAPQPVAHTPARRTKPAGPVKRLHDKKVAPKG